MSNKDFYRAFEDTHRGSRELIKDRLKVYLPFVLPLRKIYSDVNAIDIGCGRGEWLELLNEVDISALGIDMDAGMLESCHKLGLNVILGDGINILKEQVNESATLISAYHVIEHISFDQLQIFIKEALRVLKPGGLLIMETPNSENIKVASQTFYLDPTHTKPIPSSLLAYLTEYYGFIQNKIIRINEFDDLSDQLHANLEQVLEFVSPDYAIIAQKDASVDILNIFEEAFSNDFGLSLLDVTKKFDKRTEEMELAIAHAMTRANEAIIQSNEAAIQSNEAVIQSNEAWNNYYAITNSTSWKITKPIRLIGKMIKFTISKTKSWITFIVELEPKRILKNFIIASKYYINTHTKFKTLILYILKPFPQFKAKMKSIANQHDAQEINSTNVLSPRARQIYNELKRSIQK